MYSNRKSGSADISLCKHWQISPKGFGKKKVIHQLSYYTESCSTTIGIRELKQMQPIRNCKNIRKGFSLDKEFWKESSIN
jgi:hypothetical protein